MSMELLLCMYISTGPPLPPKGITSTLTSSCHMTVDWALSQPADNNTYADSDNFKIEIQLVNIDWIPLLERDRDVSSGTVLVLFNGLNTSFYLRGRSFNSTWGVSEYSTVYGPFVAYPSNEVPVPTDVSASPNGPLSLEVTWFLSGGCYQIVSFMVVCMEESPSSAEVQMLLMSAVFSTSLSNLKADTYYNCQVVSRVRGRNTTDLSDNLELERASAIVKTFTFPMSELHCIT